MRVHSSVRSVVPQSATGPKSSNSRSCAAASYPRRRAAIWSWTSSSTERTGTSDAHPEREAQRRHRGVLDTRGAIDGEAELDHYAGDRFGIRGSIGSRAPGLMPVERFCVEVPSGWWPPWRS